MSADFSDFAIGAGLNLLSAIIIVRFIYYPWTQNRSYVFTFLAFNPTIYFVMALLTSIELSVGVGFGLTKGYTLVYLSLIVLMPRITKPCMVTPFAWMRTTSPVPSPCNTGLPSPISVTAFSMTKSPA